MEAEFARLLSEYNRWANARILNAAAELSASDYHAPAAGLSFGSLHGTLVHTLAAEVVWLARWRGEQPPAELRDARRSDVIARDVLRDLDAVRQLWRREAARQVEFFAGLQDADLTRTIAYRTQYGEPFEQPLQELLLHFLNHGTQFRAEAAVRLTQLSRSPGDLDLIVFLRQRESQASGR